MGFSNPSEWILLLMTYRELGKARPRHRVNNLRVQRTQQIKSVQQQIHNQKPKLRIKNLYSLYHNPEIYITICQALVKRLDVKDGPLNPSATVLNRLTLCLEDHMKLYKQNNYKDRPALFSCQTIDSILFCSYKYTHIYLGICSSRLRAI